jgi:hypothetical protein
VQKAQFGTAAEAKAMEERVIAALKANESAAIARFNKADGGFRDRDLYVFCFNTMTGIFSAPRANVIRETYTEYQTQQSRAVPSVYSGHLAGFFDAPPPSRACCGGP